MKHPRPFAGFCLCLLLRTTVWGEDFPINDLAPRAAMQAAFTSISVDIKQARFSAATQDIGKTRLQKLVWASVDAGGTQIPLDWSNSQQAEMVLTENAMPNHGDLREPRLSLIGTLEFRGRNPVIVIKSAKVELLHAYEIGRKQTNVFESIVK